MAEIGPAVESTILSTLAGDAGVTRLLGGPKVFGPAPGSHSFPYVTLGRTSVVDWSCGATDEGEHVLTLHVWAGGGGKAATFEIMDRVCDTLHDKALPLEGTGMVHLRLRFAQARQEPESPNYHGILRFSATRQSIA